MLGVNTDKGKDIKLPIKQSQFQEYVDLGYLTTNFKILVSFEIFLFILRFLRIMADKFPAFGALFAVIKVAAVDLMMFGLVMLILAFGYNY